MWHICGSLNFGLGPPTKKWRGIVAVIGLQIKSCPLPRNSITVYFRHRTARKQPTLKKFEEENWALLPWMDFRYNSCEKTILQEKGGSCLILAFGSLGLRMIIPVLWHQNKVCYVRIWLIKRYQTNNWLHELIGSGSLVTFVNNQRQDCNKAESGGVWVLSCCFLPLYDPS